MENQEQMQSLQAEMSGLKAQIAEMTRLMGEMHAREVVNQQTLLHEPHEESYPTITSRPFLNTDRPGPSSQNPCTLPHQTNPAIITENLVSTDTLPGVYPYNPLNTAVPPASHVSVLNPLHERRDQSREEDKRVMEDEKISLLEQRLRAVEGLNLYGPIDITSLRMVPDVIIPREFKVPDFEKYNGNSDPRIHLATYIAKMAAVSEEEKLLIHFFHESLTGPALTWFMQLEKSRIRTWTNLADEFLKQYKFNFEAAPGRMELENMQKKGNETFREYAQRWREKAAQVIPPLTDHELCSYFLNTLRPPFFEMMIANATSSFADLIKIGERIEVNLRSGRLQDSSSESSSTKRGQALKKKEGEIHVISGQRLLPTSQPNFQARGPREGNYHYPQPKIYPNTYDQNLNQYRYSQTPVPQRFPSQPSISSISSPYIQQPFPPTYPTYQPPRSQLQGLRPDNPPFDQRNYRNNRNREPWTPLPVPLTDIYHHLLRNNMIAPVPLPPLRPPYPKWYNENARCEYHAGAIGHPTENCVALRNQVQKLIDAGWFKLEKEGNTPNVNTNPLPNHETPDGRTVGMIEEIGGLQEIMDVSDLMMPMKELFQILLHFGYIQAISLTPKAKYGDFDPEANCLFHQGAKGHDIQDCGEFLKQVQRMMALRLLRFEKRNKCADTSKQNVMMISGSEKVEVKPTVLRYKEQSSPQMKSMYTPPIVTIKAPTQLPYSNTHAVPWNYNYQVHTQLAQTQTSPTLKSSQLNTLSHISAPPPIQPITSIMYYKPSDFPISTQNQPSDPVVPKTLELTSPDIQPTLSPTTTNMGIGSITRSGRCYTPEDLEKARKLKAKIGELVVTSEEEEVIEKEKGHTSEDVNESEEECFLRLMKQSEYSVVDQLKKTPARISLLSLILNSEPHRQALQKILNRAYVTPDITTENFGKLVNQIQAANFISFSDEEIDSAGMGHTKALHITLRCHGCTVAKVLIDNGSALNVLPRATLQRLPVDSSLIKTSSMVVRAFDGTKREVDGDIELLLEIGACTFKVSFQIMNVNSNYAMLLGRPWIHSAGVVPSSLHQKLKYISEGRLVTVRGEEDLFVSKPHPVPYIETAEEAPESSFQALEIVGSASFEKPTARPICPKRLIAEIMMKQGYCEGKGLGVNLQGVSEPVMLPKNEKRFGLGYKPTLRDLHLFSARDQRFDGISWMEKEMVIPHIRDTFPEPTKKISNEHVIKEGAVMDSFTSLSINNLEPVENFDMFIRQCDESLNNWEIEDLPVIFNSE